MHLRPSLNAGFGTIRTFLGEEAERVDSTAQENKITLRQTTGKSSFTQTKVANDGSKSQLGAREVYLAEKRAAEDTIQRQDIPAGYRQYLKRYFDGIQPPESDSNEDR